MSETVGYVFIVAGLALDLIGCVGLIRFPDVFSRLQATAKCVTLGTCSILLGAVIIKGFTATGMKSLLCILFLIMISPVAAHALGRGAHISGVRPWEKSVCDKYEEDNKAGR